MRDQTQGHSTVEHFSLSEPQETNLPEFKTDNQFSHLVIGRALRGLFVQGVHGEYPCVDLHCLLPVSAPGGTATASLACQLR